MHHERQNNNILRPKVVSINGEPIKRVSKVKYLWIAVDEYLTWNGHYEKLKCRIIAALSSLQKLKNILTQSELTQVYNALFESHLRYRDEIWSNLWNAKLQHFQHLQTRAKTLIENSRSKVKG